MTSTRHHGFTLIELLVVISIIALLIGILLPALGTARSAARSLQSLSNVRQWGIGFVSFADQNKGLAPWDGEDNPTGGGGNNGWSVPYWWGNGVPPYLGQDRYPDLVARRIADGQQIPMPPENTIYTDPNAQVPTNAPYPTAAANPRYFFCYVPNSKLDSNGPTIDGQRRVKVDLIPEPSNTVFMLEIRTVRDELPSTDGNYTKTLDRAKADWQRMAARHSEGGHLLFGDGHGEHVKNKYASTAGIDHVTGQANSFNKSDLIWNPFGRAN